MVMVLSALVLDQGCKKDKDVATDPTADALMVSNTAEARLINPGKGYNVVNLVSDVSQYSPAHLDGNLVNAWGLAFGPTGGVWISAADKGISVIYDQNGNTLHAPVSVPFGDDPKGASPTGQVYNFTTSFMIPMVGAPVASAVGGERISDLPGIPSKFIFATENGTIAAWSTGITAVTVADRSSAGAVYKGLAIARDGDAYFLYATDFHNGKIDVFDTHFNYVTSKPFTDARIPSGFAPFNIKNVGGKLIVTYAKQLAPENKDDESGRGNGYVDVFRTDGTLLMRLASRGNLNSPWGIAVLKTNMGFGNDNYSSGEMEDNDEQGEVERSPIILVGNFGDGKINAFNMNGNFLGQLMSNGKVIQIEGLWALSYAPQGNPAYHDSRNRLYFTAGPADEEHGIFGYITRLDY